MSFIPVPKNSILDHYEFYRVINGKKVWRTDNGKRYYLWDSQHGEIEVFNQTGDHLGVIEPEHGALIKDAITGRHLNVR